MTKTISRFLTVLMAVFGTAIATAPAQAVTTVYTFEGYGPESATASLTLDDYTPGSSLTLSNFVSFVFGSPSLSYTIDASDVVSFAGSFLTVPGQNFVNILTQDFAFVSTPFGPWCTGGNPTCGAVTGGDHLWTLDTPTVPEPAAWALMLLGFGLVGATLRQRRGTAVVTA